MPVVRRDCEVYNAPIELRLMPNGRYVAFVPGTERLHKHSDVNPDQRELFTGERMPSAVLDPGKGGNHNPSARIPKQGVLFDNQSENPRPRTWPVRCSSSLLNYR